MKIKHKLTNDIIELSYTEWEEQYLPRQLSNTFEIIEKDVVLLRLIKSNGQRENYKKVDRNYAIEVIKSKPLEYDFIDISTEKIVNGKREPILNPTFKVINKTNWLKISKTFENIILGILIAGFGGLLTYFLIELFN